MAEQDIHFAVEHSTTIENTFATQWVATAPFFAEPYKGSDAYITHDGFIQPMVTCVRRRRWNFRGHGKFQGRRVDTHGTQTSGRTMFADSAFHALTELLQRSGMCRQVSSVLPLFFSRPVRLGPLAPFHCRASAPRSPRAAILNSGDRCRNLAVSVAAGRACRLRAIAGNHRARRMHGDRRRQC